jgi:hypothetical protein
MEKACLVTGKSGPLLVEIVRCMEDLQHRTLVTRSGQMDLGDINEESTSVIAWNRRSALSARSVLLHASNIFGRLNEAIIVFGAAPDTTTLHESSIVGIEDRIDAEVKGYIYILRETLSSLLKQGGGSIALVIHQAPADLRSPLEATATGAFLSLAESTARLYRNEPISIRQFRSESDDIGGFARFISERTAAAEDRSNPRRRRPGRWLTFPSGRLRPGFLGR